MLRVGLGELVPFLLELASALLGRDLRGERAALERDAPERGLGKPVKF